MTTPASGKRQRTYVDFNGNVFDISGTAYSSDLELRSTLGEIQGFESPIVLVDDLVDQLRINYRTRLNKAYAPLASFRGEGTLYRLTQPLLDVSKGKIIVNRLANQDRSVADLQFTLQGENLDTAINRRPFTTVPFGPTNSIWSAGYTVDLENTDSKDITVWVLIGGPNPGADDLDIFINRRSSPGGSAFSVMDVRNQDATRGYANKFELTHTLRYLNFEMNVNAEVRTMDVVLKVE